MKNKIKLIKNNGQQGDVLLVRLDKMPDGEQKILARKRLVVAHGESGHSHVIEDDEAELVQIGERMLLKLTRSVTITHEEHKPIRIQPGVWDVTGRVQEFDYFQMMQRQVID